MIKLDEKVYDPVAIAKGEVPVLANLYGTVTDAQTGEPLAGVDVSIDMLSTSTGADGTYAFIDLDPGGYLISFVKGGYDYLQQEVILAPGDNVLDVELAPIAPTLANLSGRVTDALTGDPLPGVVISINALSTSTDTDGRYAFVGLEPGSYTIRFEKAGYETLEQAISLVEGDNVFDVELASITPPPGKAILVVDTTPVKGEVYLDGVDQGVAPVTLEVDPGTYTISFGDVEGYIPPEDLTVTLAEGDILRRTGEYTPVGLAIPSWAVWAMGAAGVGIGALVLYTVIKGKTEVNHA